MTYFSTLYSRQWPHKGLNNIFYQWFDPAESKWLDNIVYQWFNAWGRKWQSYPYTMSFYLNQNWKSWWGTRAAHLSIKGIIETQWWIYQQRTSNKMNVLTLDINIHNAPSTVRCSNQGTIANASIQATVACTGRLDCIVKRLRAYCWVDCRVSCLWSCKCRSTMCPFEIGNRYSTSGAGQCQWAAFIHVHPDTIYWWSYLWWHWSARTQTHTQIWKCLPKQYDC